MKNWKNNRGCLINNLDNNSNEIVENYEKKHLIKNNIIHISFNI